MDLRDIKRIAADEGFVVNICPVNMHVDIRADDFDEESITFLVATKEGYVKEDDAILHTDGSIIAYTEEELAAWLNAKVA